MPYPSISQWIDTVANSRGRFRTLGEFEPLRDAYGNVKFTAGNSAAVFTIVAGGRRMMLKCFIKERDDRRALYEITAGGDSLLAPTRLLPGEAYVYDDLGNGAFYSVAIGEWVDGSTLETEIARAARELGARRFAELAAIFDNLATELLAREWAHGDLKPDNIVITPDGKAVLIDYDAIYLPGGEPTGEAGTPGFQHPSRTENDYGKHLDDYPIALISISLHALTIEPLLWKTYHKGDGLILNPEEVCAGRSEAYDKILRLFADMGEYGLYNLTAKLRRPTADIPELGKAMAKCTATKSNNTPQLFESEGLWGYRTEGGAEMTPAIFDEAFEFSEGLAVAKLCGNLHVIDTCGRMKFKKVSGTDAIKPFGCGLAAFRCGGKWGYLDTTGRVVIALLYDRARRFCDGMAEVEIAGDIFCIDLLGKRV